MALLSSIWHYVNCFICSTFSIVSHHEHLILVGLISFFFSHALLRLLKSSFIDLFAIHFGLPSSLRISNSNIAYYYENTYSIIITRHRTRGFPRDLEQSYNNPIKNYPKHSSPLSEAVTSSEVASSSEAYNHSEAIQSSECHPQTRLRVHNYHFF